MATLKEFLTTGRLGEIAPGVSKDSVRQLLGEPEDVSGQRNPELWKYGALQLGFHQCRGEKQPALAFIGLYFKAAGAGIPNALAWTGWLPPPGTSFKAFQDWLADAGLNDSAALKVTGDANEYLIMHSGVRITFDDGNLHSIQYTAQRTPERRQLSVSLPTDLWDRIREEAAQQRVSMAELCSRWIRDHVRESTGAASS